MFVDQAFGLSRSGLCTVSTHCVALKEVDGAPFGYSKNLTHKPSDKSPNDWPRKKVPKWGGGYRDPKPPGAKGWRVVEATDITHKLEPCQEQNKTSRCVSWDAQERKVRFIHAPGTSGRQALVGHGSLGPFTPPGSPSIRPKLKKPML